ncbi:unnamed protein product [Lactuca virosa]|uniref:Uncharacterized protein n=1 Tax=Lactuca virosa TaxID=75947 RepID=A0AAU9MA86_9ASTR|nr:unnamed protein product [Lactuca virosa]
MKSNHHLKTMLGNLKGGRSHAGLSRRSDCHVYLIGLPSSASWQDLKVSFIDILGLIVLFMCFLILFGDIFLDHMCRYADVFSSQVFRDRDCECRQCGCVDQHGSSGASEMEMEILKLDWKRSMQMQFVDWVGDCKKKRRLDHRLGGNCDVDSKKYRFRKKNASAIGLIPQNHRKILLTLVRTRT